MMLVLTMRIAPLERDVHATRAPIMPIGASQLCASPTPIVATSHVVCREDVVEVPGEPATQKSSVATQQKTSAIPTPIAGAQHVSAAGEAPMKRASGKKIDGAATTPAPLARHCALAKRLASATAP